MKTSLHKLLLTTLLACVTISAAAYDFEVDGIYYNVVSLSDLTCEVTSSGDDNQKYSGDIVIPSSATYRGRTLSVVSIGYNAFYGCSGLTSITIPDGVTSIGGRAFYNCGNLTFINIPDGVTHIGDYAFQFCSGLTSINIPDKVTYISDHAFFECSGLASVTIGNGVTYIGDRAFYGCSGVTSLTVGNDYSLGEVLSYVGNTVETIVLEEDFVDDEISAYIAEYCSKLSKLIVKTNKKLAWSNSGRVSHAQYLNLEVIVPKKLLSYYQTADVWKEFWNLKENDEDSDTPTTCEAPTITFDNTTKQLKFESATSGAKYHCTIKSDDMMTDKSNDGTAQMTGVYDITAYASAEGMYNSAKVTAKLVWVNAEIDTDVDVISAKTQRGVIVTTSGEGICISGTLGGETINVYNAAGSLLKSVKAQGDNTVVSGLGRGGVYVVKIGGTSVKVAL